MCPSSLYWCPALVPRRSSSTPLPAFTKTAPRCSSKRWNKVETGTPSARARACSVVSDGEVLPFSILDSIPTERPVVVADLADRQPECFAQDSDFMADRLLEIVLARFTHGMGVLTSSALGPPALFICPPSHAERQIIPLGNMSQLIGKHVRRRLVHPSPAALIRSFGARSVLRCHDFEIMPECLGEASQHHKLVGRRRPSWSDERQAVRRG